MKTVYKIQRLRKLFKKKKLFFSLTFSDKGIENVIFHLNRILLYTTDGNFYREEGGVNCGRITKRKIPGWREVQINVTDFIYLPNKQAENRLYSAERRKLLGALRGVYNEKRQVYIGEWHVHVSGNPETSRQDDLNMLGRLRWQKYILLMIITKSKTQGGGTKYIITPYLYFRKWWIQRFKWKLDEMEIILPKEKMTWKYLLNYSGNKEVRYN